MRAENSCKKNKYTKRNIVQEKNLKKHNIDYIIIKAEKFDYLCERANLQN